VGDCSDSPNKLREERVEDLGSGIQGRRVFGPHAIRMNVCVFVNLSLISPR
jgi:hypothetical protein